MMCKKIFQQLGIRYKKQCPGQLLVKGKYIYCVKSGKWIIKDNGHSGKWFNSTDVWDFLRQIDITEKFHKK